MRDEVKEKAEGSEEVAPRPQRKKQDASEIVEMSFEGTQSIGPPEALTIAPGSSEGPSEVTSSLGKTTELIQRGLAKDPRPKSVKALSILVGVLS